MSRIVAIDPSTGAPVREVASHDDAEIERRVGLAHDTFQRWRAMSLDDRAECFRRAADLLEERADEWAALMAEEMGKPLAQGRGEAEKCAWVCRFYADHAPDWLAPEPVDVGVVKAMVRHDPLGPVFAVMPWNFPFWQLFRFAAPALMAGNTAVLKHAESVPGCALAIERIFREAGFPDGVLVTVLADHDQAARILADDRVAAATLTGSTRAGEAIAAQAGRALKPTVLELGGSDPFVVLADADVDRAAEVAVTARTQNSGQSCIAAKRFIVVEAVAQAFVDRFRERLAALVVGDPRDPSTDVGPLARADLREALHDQVTRSVAAGARLELGGGIPDGNGFFYPVTLLTGVAPGMPAWDEETFGPVAAVRVVSDDDAAIEAANDHVYGLGASIWTQDRERGARLAARIEAGAVFVNAMVRSDPRVPFGGVKRSGYGRELSRHGLMAFVNHKTVWVE